jgi:hypothetical protein
MPVPLFLPEIGLKSKTDPTATIRCAVRLGKGTFEIEGAAAHSNVTRLRYSQSSLNVH